MMWTACLKNQTGSNLCRISENSKILLQRKLLFLWPFLPHSSVVQSLKRKFMQKITSPSDKHNSISDKKEWHKCTPPICYFSQWPEKLWQSGCCIGRGTRAKTTPSDWQQHSALNSDTSMAPKLHNFPSGKSKTELNVLQHMYTSCYLICSGQYHINHSNNNRKKKRLIAIMIFEKEALQQALWEPCQWLSSTQPPREFVGRMWPQTFEFIGHSPEGCATGEELDKPSKLASARWPTYW